MAAGVGDHKLIIRIDFLAGNYLHFDRLALLSPNRKVVGVNHKFRINQITMILDQPVNTVELATFFISRKGENDIAIRNETPLLHLDEGGDHNRSAVFHILCAAAIKIAILLDKLKRIGSPIL